MFLHEYESPSITWSLSGGSTLGNGRQEVGQKRRLKVLGPFAYPLYLAMGIQASPSPLLDSYFLF